jgi:ATP-dependent helicase/nuclease subunit A
MSDLVIPPVTRQAQARASDPHASAWVSANAGSGKTTVLSHRVIRLLLDGVDPARILCITFTKAAAANMAARVFGTLGTWVSLTDEALAGEVERIDGRAPGRDRLRRARRLFACAVETPGGLKIQTIHAFCERLLHLFPFEANVAARFEVLDDLGKAELLARAQAEVLARAEGPVDPALAEALATVNEASSEDRFEGLVACAMKLTGFLREEARGEEGLAALRARIAVALGLPADATRADIVRDILVGGFPQSEWPAAIAELSAGSVTEKEVGEDLKKALLSPGLDEALRAYVRAMVTAKGDKARADSTKFVGKDFVKRLPVLAAILQAESRRVFDALDRLRAVEALDRTMALMRIADAVAARYEAAKVTRGALDFDDLIGRTAALLSRADAAFVLYKLDRGIDHILVDEAQDTSEAQWAILRAIAEDFVAGEGRTTRPRTIFAVGDPKQSIFSFQGAAPAVFEEMRRTFGARINALKEVQPARWAFHDESLTLSFRSAPEILQAVDWVFGVEAHYASLGFAAPGPTSHTSARPSAPGLVELWDTEKPVVVAEPDAWAKPLDEPEAGAPAVRLAARIADLVARWQSVGDETGRLIRPGDVLILVRQRNAFFEAVIRALKERGVPVAGADRLVLTRHIAVLDLVVLGRASLLPDDDLTLAALLKSPLVGLGEEDLLRAAWGRGRTSLAAAVTALAASDPLFARVEEKLARWRGQAQRCGPFSFYAGVLGPEGGRRAMLSRLGAEARDAVDEFLRLALEHEQRQPPSLSLFLAGLDGVDLTIRRDMDDSADEVRVMTVHGAKGLEAPVVFLADTCSAPDGRRDSPLLMVPDATGGKLPVWSSGKKHDCAATAAARARLQAGAWQEYHRLLYVGMTRARDRLYVCGYESQNGRPAGCWYDMVSGTLAPYLTREDLPDGRSIGRYQTRPFSPAAAAAAVPEASPDEDDLAWLSEPAPPEPVTRPPLRPSSALDAADAPPRGVDTPFMREARLAGTVTHALLESLPAVDPARRAEVAAALAATRGAGLPPERRARIVGEILALLADPGLAPLFGPGSRAEAPLSGQLPLGPGGAMVPVSGQVDRLAVTATQVLVADYKTRADPPRTVEEVPASHLAQLAVYRGLLRHLFPDRPVRCLLVWTSGPAVMTIPETVLDSALARIKAA